MAMEDAILRLARAVEAQEETTAVREIIRQRDAAQLELQRMTRDRDSWESIARNRGDSMDAKNRRIAALQGVITRMKKGRA